MNMGNSNSDKMRILMIVMSVLFLILVPETVDGRPSGIASRQKRGSDQRLAELQTLLALAQVRGKLVTVPIGFGQVDPAKVGRRRRSNSESSIQRLKRYLQAIADDSESVGEERSTEHSPIWQFLTARRRDEQEDQLI